jgi:hypothetical protein
MELKMSTAATRDHVINFLRREVLGPDPITPLIQSNGEELILDSPKNRYGAGILFPQKSVQVNQVIGSETDQPTDSEDVDDNEETSKLQDDIAEAPEEVEQEVALTNEYLPSAMGLSTLLEVPDELIVQIDTGKYQRGEKTAIPSFTYIKKDEKGIEYCDFPKNLQQSFKQKDTWARVPFVRTISIFKHELLSKDIKEFWKHIEVGEQREQLALHVVTRPLEGGDKEKNFRLITLTLVNTHVSQPNATLNEECYFQTSFKVKGNSNEACFVPYPDYTFDANDSESRSLFLLYRHKSVFAVGHGCAANWSGDEPGRASVIFTDALPLFEIKPVRPRLLKEINLSMKSLSLMSDKDILENCTRLTDSYRNWIKERVAEAQNDSSLSSELRKTASEHLKKCRQSHHRMVAGIKCLSRDSASMRSFRLMNEAMYLQRAHYNISANKRRIWSAENGKAVLAKSFEKPVYSDDTGKWYPFQLGFILMNIQGIIEPEHSDRNIVDLIWFPTGGGKTEAYLGLTAFVLFHRKLKNDDSPTTAVLMRYTLRLLTTQQFQRAASLICACEVLRKKYKELGKTPFSIGLWVGGDVTPNTGDSAYKALQSLGSGGENKFIVTSCPWCGCQLGPISAVGGKKDSKGYRSITKTRVILHCEDHDCDFFDRLPVSVVDEDIYREPPSLIVGTVDKFAMLPWLSASGALFGHVRGNVLSPPDLIIQDELHLISGPLGSVVGLYEPLIDLLSTRNSIGPKIIASTATISRADEQVQALYGRKSALFPPQALVAADSFFAEEDLKAEGRTYVGVFGSGFRSHATSQVRTMSALLQSVKRTNFSPSEVDPYWTLIGYFNSLRELGHAVTLVGADIVEHIAVICERMGINKRGDDMRKILNEEELTSRVSSTELPEKLNKLFTEYRGELKYQATDVCFATNMIQVGLDVSRLSLMVVVGQPKTTSEYIQASSRVGREANKPGLVVVNYNPSKPRDRSHFERFKQYHQSIYRYVEPTSVTPFAVPVRERALHALVIALVRLWGPASICNSPRGTLEDDLINRVTNSIIGRVEAAEPEEAQSTKEMIDRIFKRWKADPASKYGDFGNMQEEPVPLMHQFGSRSFPSWEERSFETPNNMRSVDKDCEGQMIRSYLRS